MRNTIMTAFITMLSINSAQALEFIVGEERANDRSESYEVGLIKLALEKADGEHTLSYLATGEANQQRMLDQLAKGEAEFHLVFSGIDQERYEKLAVVPIPLQRGLLGHRILIVSQDSKEAVGAVQTMDDLKKIVIGSGTGWPDTEILRAAGLNVEDAKYDNLFKMVDRGRIHSFARGAAEPFTEVAARKDEMANLTIDEHVMIVYPFDMFLMLNKDDKERFDILLQGLNRAYEDGSFMSYFENHPRIKEVFVQAKIDQRVRFDIPNPLLPAEIATIPASYWHGR